MAPARQSPLGFYLNYVTGSFALPSNPNDRIPYAALSGVWPGWSDVLRVAALPGNSNNDGERQNAINQINQAMHDNFDAVAASYAPSLVGQGDDFFTLSQNASSDDSVDYSDPAAADSVSLSASQLASLTDSGSGILSRLESLSTPVKIGIVLLGVFLLRSVFKRGR